MAMLTEKPAPRRLRQRSLVLAALALLVLAVAGVALLRQRQSVATRGLVDGFLARAGLEQVITYQELSVSLGGSDTLSGVTIHDDAGQMAARIERVTLSGLPATGAQNADLHLALQASSIAVPLQAPTPDRRPLWQEQLSALGLSTLAGDVGLSLGFARDTGTLSVDLRGLGTDLGDGEAHLVVDHLGDGALQALLDLAMATRQGGVLGMAAAGLTALQTVKDARLVRLQIRLDDTALIRRSQAADTLAPPLAAARLDQKALLRAGFSQAQVQAMQDAVQLFLTKGGTLRAETHLSAPLPLTRPGGFFGPVFAFHGPLDLLAASGLVLSN